VGGSAILEDGTLVDDLVPLIDDLRGELHQLFGVRAYRTHRVKRTWAGAFIGEGTFVDEVVEILPQPKVWTWDGLRWGMGAAGLNEMGEIQLTEVSLTYTEAELTGGTLPANVQWMFRISEAHGQGSSSRHFAHVRPPFVDREQDMGWILWLKFVDVPS
jgi:hypothetical protein